LPNSRHLYKILLQTYENPPVNFEDNLGIKGIGPATLRSLALTAEIIFGPPASTRDPARPSFAPGGKDRIPYPMNRKGQTTDPRSHTPVIRSLSNPGCPPPAKSYGRPQLSVSQCHIYKQEL